MNSYFKDYEVDVYLRQKWQDERLKHEQITEALDLNDPNLVKAIWIPEVYFPNAKNAEFQYVTVPNVLVRINPDGGILYMLRLKLTFACMMDLAKFPLDSQICTMEVASFSKTTEELRLEWKPTNPVTMGKMRMPQFEIVDIMADECQESFQIDYNSATFSRKLQLSGSGVLPQSLRWIPLGPELSADDTHRGDFLGVLLDGRIQRGLPQVSYVKAIDVWMGTCTAFVFCALLEFTIVNYMWRRQPEMPKKKLTNMSQAADSGGAGTPTSANGDASTAPVKVCFPEESNPPPEYMQETSSSMELNHMRCTSAVQSHRSPGTIPEFEGDLSYLDSRLPRLSQCRGSPLYSKVLARKIDEWSRLCFPLAFIAFNLFYWPYYMLA
ncbi:hypothetical protein J437_LFUL018401 [Ladona fulva]|uniref:Glycine receptor beta n=1 Tax=Ladona fulva TaxID=123851 RepID=A0A8K0PB07_LADFU|nr:hypothetical protein J437_LFUL018401 [Ladona fulva]